MNDCRRISRRVVLTSTALSLGAAAAAAVVSQAAGRSRRSARRTPNIRHAEGRPTLRRLRQFPTEWDYQFTTSMAQQYLAIKPKHDGGATGPIVTRYRNVTAARARLTLSGGQKVTGPGAAPGAAILVP